jgi:hypothetical protein
MQYLKQHNSKQRLVHLITLLVALVLPLAVIGSATAEEATVTANASQLTTAFTYQGQLKRAGGAYDGDCAFQFGLWDSETDGAALATQSLTNVTVVNGLFTAQLDFGNQFTGDARWLEVQVQCQDDANYTTMTPRVLLTSSPYAIGLMPGAQIIGTINSTAGVVKVVNYGEGSAILGLAVPATVTTYGILGNAFSPNGTAVGGYTENGGTAVRGIANDSGHGVYGSSTTGIGVYGESALFEGVRGQAHDVNHGAVVGLHDGGGFGVFGNSPHGAGVVGTSIDWVGAYGESTHQAGVWGKSQNGIGVYGESTQSAGVQGLSRQRDHGGVVGINEAGGAGVYGRSTGDGFAMVADGKLSITGGGDVAERFASVDSQPIAPGSVVVVDGANPGQLTRSTAAYDTKVIGIISGAGGVEPGLILHQAGMLEGNLVVAIAGRVYCNADAESAPIAPGDLLTSADRPGYCMKAADRDRAYGAIIGKALTGLDNGVGQVLVLVNLQ